MWGRGDARSLGRRAIGALEGATLASTVTVALVRLLGIDTNTYAVAAAALLPLALLPAYPVLLVAFVLRQRLAGGMAAIVVVAHVVFAGPVLWPFRPGPPPTGGGAIRMLVVNLRSANTDVDGLVDAIRAVGPDLVAIIELTPRHLADLRGSGALDSFSHEIVRPSIGTEGLGLWSTSPIAGRAWLAGAHPQLQGDLRVPGMRPVTVEVVHTYAPVDGAVPEWRRELDAIADEVVGVQTAVVAGDLNATESHPAFERILDTGLHDAAIERGQGRTATWPVGHPFLPPLVRPDHVLVTDDIAVIGYDVLEISGSDHRGLVVDLVLPARRAP